MRINWTMMLAPAALLTLAIASHVYYTFDAVSFIGGLKKKKRRNAWPQKQYFLNSLELSTWRPFFGRVVSVLLSTKFASTFPVIFNYRSLRRRAYLCINVRTPGLVRPLSMLERSWTGETIGGQEGFDSWVPNQHGIYERRRSGAPSW